MGSVLVFLQQQEGKILKASLVALSAARAVAKTWSKSEIVGVCLGAGAQSAAQSALEFGLSKVFACDAAAFEKYRAVPYAAVVVAAAREAGADTLVSPATSVGKDFMPRVAAQLEAGQASDIVGINGDGSLRRPLFAGNVFADVEITTPIRVITVRATGFPAAEKTSGGGTVVPLAVPSFEEARAGEMVGYELSRSDRPELGDAEIVVSGGRALQSSENFEKYIFPLADSLGAAVGASRAAVDSGYAPNDWQVGQTGKVVAPNLYVAVGISGAIQHLAGMKDSKVIVALNKDADAPIFEVADYGLVADLFSAVPELTEAIKRAKAG